MKLTTLFTILTISIGSCFAQLSQQNPPVVLNRSIDWARATPTGPQIIVDNNNAIPSGQFVEQAQSGEDWWFDTKPVYENGNQVGYIAVGFTRYKNLHFSEHNLFPKGLINSPSNLPPDCQNIVGNQNDGESETLSDYRQVIALFDLKGNMLWCKPHHLAGGLNSVVADGNGNYYATGECKTGYKYGGTVKFQYNPILGQNPIYLVDNVNPPQSDEYNGSKRIIVYKFNQFGDEIWSFQYGDEDLVLAQNQSDKDANSVKLKDLGCTGAGIQLNDSKNEIIIAANNRNNNPIYLRIDLNGYIIQKNVSINSNLFIRGFQCRNGECVAVGGTVHSAAGQFIDGKGFIEKINQSNLATVNDGFWPGNPLYIDFDNQFEDLSSSLNDIWIEEDKSMIIPGTHIIDGSMFNGDNKAYHVLLKMDKSGSIVNSFVDNNLVQAYDLRMGIIKTNDGNYAIVSSTKSKENIDFTDVITNFNNLYNRNCFANTLGQPNPPKYFNTDSYIYKISPSFTKLWEMTFDSDDNIPMVYPGDMKKQECMYKIAEGPDGSLFIVGNSSHNTDDYYAALVSSNCQNQDIYRLPQTASPQPLETTIGLGQIVTWNPSTFSNNIVRNKGVIRIQNGAILTIENLELQFANEEAVGQECKIIVEPGGKLILNNSKLTKVDCEKNLPWAGVVVLGRWDLPQTDAYQGVIQMTNSSIEHAIEAIIPGDFHDFSKNGGIIRATQSTFRNNKRSVQLLSYPSPNPIIAPPINAPYAASFSDCVFEWTKECIFDAPQAVTMFQVKGVNFLGCDFIDSRTNIPDENRAKGIFTIDAGFAVLGRTTSPSVQNTDYFVLTNQRDNSRFINMKTGIEALQSNGLQTVRCDYSIFENCKNGILLNNNMNSMITRNLFDYKNSNIYIPLSPVGLTFNTARGYTVEGNIFSNTDNFANVTGTRTINSGPDDNEIRRNEMSGNSYANIAEGLNRGEDANGEQSGLSYICNNQSINNVDIQIQGSGIEGIRRTQGDLFGTAQNSFSNGFAAINLNNSSPGSIDYFIETPNDIFDPQISLNTVKVSTPNENTCPSIFNTVIVSTNGVLGLQQIGQVISNISEQTIGRDVKLTAFEAKLELGDSPSLFFAVENMNIMTRNNVRSLLQSASPYLSEELLVSIGGIPSAIFPETWYRDLIIENIEVVKWGGFMNFLESKSEPLSLENITLIKQAANSIVTQRGLDIAELAEMNRKIEAWKNILITHYLIDSTELAKANVSALLLSKENNHRELYEIDHLLANGNLNEAILKLNNLELKAQSPQYEEVSMFWSNFVSYKRFYLSLLNDKNSIGLPLSPSSITQLINYRDNGLEYVSNQAGNLLCFFTGDCKELTDVHTINQLNLIINDNSDLQFNLDNQEIIWEVYPNPSENEIVIRRKDSDAMLKTVDLIDATGRLISSNVILDGAFATKLDLSELSSGSYFIRITDKFGISETQLIYKR